MDDIEEILNQGLIRSHANRINEGAVKESFTVGVNGNEYVLQTPQPGDEFRLPLIARLTEKVRDRTEIPAPGIVYDGSGRDIPFLVFEKVGGENPQSFDALTTEEQKKVAYDSGRYLRELHESIRVGKPGYVRGSEEDVKVVGEFETWPEFLIEYTGTAVERANKSDNEAIPEPELAESLMKDILGRIEVSTDISVLHNDWKPKNLLLNGYNVEGVVDWDLAIAGDGLYELARADHRFYTTSGKNEVSESLLEGYGVEAEITDHPLYRVYELSSAIIGLQVIGYFGDYTGYEKEMRPYVDFYHRIVDDTIEKLASGNINFDSETGLNV